MKLYVQFLQLTQEQACQALSSSAAGLSTDEAQKRLHQYGRNILKGRTFVWWHLLLRQLSSPLVYLLFFAAGLALFFGQMIDGLLILAVTIINVCLTFYQEYKSEQAVKLLQNYLARFIKVKRDGQEVVIDTRLLVPGDVIHLLPGTIVPADVRFIEDNNIVIDESMLTGESLPVKKISTPIDASLQELYEVQNCGFAGTKVVSGSAFGLVIATGQQTVIGEIAQTARPLQEKSSLEKEIQHFSIFILYFIAINVVLMFIANLFFKGFVGTERTVDLVNFVNFCIALAVSVVPEALPVVVMFSLSRGALRLSEHKVVVKRLQAIEDLGSMQVLCTDKTGTLTENSLTVREVFPFSGYNHVVQDALLASETEHVQIEASLENPFDKALWDFLSKHKSAQLGLSRRVFENPFTAERGMNSVVLEEDGVFRLVVRGIPEKIIESARNVTAQQKEALYEWIGQQGQEGARALAIAQKVVMSPDQWALEDGLDLLGFVSFADPIKKTAFQALEKAHQLGLIVKIITGDSKEVGLWVAQAIGLADGKNVRVMFGSEVESMPVLQRLEAIKPVHVFVRTSPEQKSMIIAALQESYEVGYIGDGVNDVPPLTKAHVAIAVQYAADVARDAADIILLKKDLKVIVDGVAVGRQIFTNITKYILTTLSENFGNFFALIIASFIVPFLPLLPTHILLIGLLSDLPCIFIATDTVAPSSQSLPSSYNAKKIGLMAVALGALSTISDLLIFIFFKSFGQSILQTNWFMTSVLTELVFIFSVRTQGPFWRAHRPSNELVFMAVSAALITVVLPFTSLGSSMFGFVPPTLWQLGIVAMIVMVYMVATDALKCFLYTRTYFKT